MQNPTFGVGFCALKGLFFGLKMALFAPKMAYFEAFLRDFAKLQNLILLVISVI